MDARWIALLVVTTALAGCFSEPIGSPEPPAPRPEPSDDDPAPPTPPTSPPDEEPEQPREQPGAQGARAWVWPDKDAASIRPGVQMFADGSQCTSNFVFLDPWNTTVYLGFAAHCVADGESTATDGCDPANEPFDAGTPVEITGASKPGTLVYSSWTAMQDAGETDPDTCAYNDFAVVRLHPDDFGLAHPAMLGFGGPTGLADPTSVDMGDKVLTYGATGLRPRVDVTDAREGYVIGQTQSGWSTTAYIASPGLPGDSGSGVLTGDGLALGILVTVGLAPYTGSNGVTSLLDAMLYAADHGLPLRLGTAPQSSGGLLP